MASITLKEQNITVSVEGGTLADACAKAGYPLNLVCNGQGKCGKCRVEILCNGEKSSVLACETRADRDMELVIPADLLQRSASVMTEGASAQSSAFAPTVRKVCRSRRELVPEHCGAWLRGCSLAAARKFSLSAAEESVRELTLVYDGEQITDVQLGDTAGTLYGAAVDIGTTTVALYAYDLTTGALLETESALNSQITRGGDVIARIEHTLRSPEGLEELHGLILQCINELLSRVEEKRPGFRDELRHVVLCGNSTMQHLFLGLHPAGLSVDPFVSVTADMVTTTGKESGLVMAESGRVDFLPLLGGFVGADTASVLLTLPENGEHELMIDLGTNGEIAVSRNGKFQVASTACGPALEGGCIECGMRGTVGAIEHIGIDDTGVHIRTIGHTEPIGLCGSAIIDAVAELLRWEVIDSTGRMLTREEYAEAHADSPLLAHLEEREEYNPCFVFSRGEKTVYLSQKDVRQIQLAKSSICSGCIALLAENGLEPADVKRLYLAGAFGSCMDIDKALYIGLLPPVPRERILSVGNGAGKGVQMCLLDRAQLSRAAALPARTAHLELAASPRFMEEYIMNMDFSS